MLFCDYCNTRLNDGRICSRCRRLLCQKCATLEKCSSCGNTQVSFKLENQEMNTYVVQWMSFEAEKRFGLVRFEEFPVIGYELLQMLPLLGEDYEMILFPSKRLSRNFARKQTEKLPEGMEILGALHEIKDKSRYTILMVEQAKKLLVLLNVLPTRESALRFLILFLNNFLACFKKVPSREKEILDIVGRSILQSVSHYNEKFGIRLFVASESTRLLILNIFVKMRTSFAEHLALRNLLNCEDLEGEISRFVSHKLELIFSLTRNSMFYSLDDVINLAGVYIDAYNIAMALADKKSLFLSAMNKIQRESRSLLKRLSKKNDLKKAIETHMKTLAEIKTYANFKSFVKRACASLVDFLDRAEPHYVWLQEVDALCTVYFWYREQMEKNPYPLNPQFGSADAFVEQMSGIFSKMDEDPRVYPEIPIICGHLTLRMLENLAKFRNDRKYYHKALEIGQKLSNAIEKSLKEIRKKNPESPLGYVDAALILTGLAKESAYFQEWDTMKALLDKARELAAGHDLTDVKLLTRWLGFLLHQDYEELLHAYRLFSRIEESDAMKLQPLLRTIGQLSAGVFEERRKFKHYADAANLALEPPISDMLPLGTASSLDDLFTGRLTYYISNIFSRVERAQRQKSSLLIEATLKEAKVYASCLEAESQIPLAPENAFAWKTMIIVELLNNDADRAEEYVQKLASLPFKSLTNEYFLKKARLFLRNLKDRNLKNMLRILDLPMEERDPWSRLLDKIVEVKITEHISHRLKLVSRAILFVEGPTEMEILPALAQRLGLDFEELGIALISLRGAPKGKYHLRMWRKITENVSLPLFILLDQDAEDEAERAIKEALVVKDHCFVLSLGSIEDYYPYEILANVIEELCGCRPTRSELVGRKAYAIDRFLKGHSYNKEWKISVGKRVGALMSKGQVHQEIRKILKKIAEKSV